MAIVYATKSGNWSDTTVWNTGALPTTADDVYSNTFTVTIDISPTVLSISNAAATGVTRGGGFTISANGITLTCTGEGIVTTYLSAGGGNVLTVSVTSGNTANVITTNAFGPQNNAPAIIFNNTGTLNFTGNLIGATGGQGSTITSSSTGTLNLTGNITGGIVSSAAALTINGANIVNVTGTITGAAGVGAANNSTGTLTHIGTAQASTGAAAIGGGAVGQITRLSGPLLSSDASAGGAAASGVNPCIALRWFPLDTALSTFEYRMRGQTVSGADRPARQMFFPNAYSSTYPSTSIVRSGTSYGPGNIYVGICSVPPREAVSFGVPVDDTTGTSLLGSITANDIWNYPISGITSTGSIGERLKNSATVNTVGKQISDAFSSN